MKHFEVESLTDLGSFIEQELLPFKSQRIILLEGPVGAGKTQLVRSYCEKLGISEVASPSYGILHHYDFDGGRIYHVDLYRLESEDDLESTGFWDLFAEPNTLIFIEWAELMNQAYLPRNWEKLKLCIELTKEGTRQLSLS